MFNYGDFSTGEVIFSMIFSTLLAFACAYYAEKKGRSSLGWFILGFLFTFIALIILFFLPPLKREKSDQFPSNSSHGPILKDLEHRIPPPTPFELYKEENRLWYYLDQKHQQMGPVSVIALRELWNRGLLEINSYVWSEGMEKWEKVDQLPELKAVLNKVPDSTEM